MFGFLPLLLLFNRLYKNEITLSPGEKKILREMRSTCLTEEDIEALVGHQFPAERAITFVHDLAEVAYGQILLEELRSELQLRPQPYDFFGNVTEQFINGSAIDNQTQKWMNDARSGSFEFRSLRRWLPSEVATAEAFFDRRLPKIRAFIRYSLTVGGKSRELCSDTLRLLSNKALSGFYQALGDVRSSLTTVHKPKCRSRKHQLVSIEPRVMYLYTVNMNGLETFLDFSDLFTGYNLEDVKEQYANELEKISFSEQDVEDMNGHTYPFKMANFTQYLASTAVEEIGLQEFRRRTHLRPRPYTFDEDIDEETDSGVNYSDDVWDNIDKAFNGRTFIHVDLRRPWLPSEVETAVNFFDRRLPVIREMFRRRLEDVVGEPIEAETSARLYPAFHSTSIVITRAVKGALEETGIKC